MIRQKAAMVAAATAFAVIVGGVVVAFSVAGSGADSANRAKGQETAPASAPTVIDLPANSAPTATTALPTTALPTTALPTTALPTTALPTTARPTRSTQQPPPPTTGPVSPPAAGSAKVLGYFVQWGIYARNYHVKNIHTSGQRQS